MNDEMRMKEGSRTWCKPKYSESMLNVINPRFYASWESNCLEFTLPNPGRNLQTFGWCLQFKQSHPWDSNILLLHAKRSRETIAIGINLLRKRVSEKVSIIYPFWKRRKPLQFTSRWHCCQKTTTSCEHKEGWKEGREKEKSRCPPAHNGDV